MARSRLLLAAWLLLWLRTAPVWAARNPREPPSVDIPGQGTVVGKEVAVSRNQKASLYLGIPFAQPPIGELRFARPVTDPLPKWKEPMDATSFGPACPQMLDREPSKILNKLLLDGTIKTSEDCLTLNVFTPDGNPPAGGWSVMLWLHPGDFHSGTTALWDGSVLAVRQKVIVVSSAYRLNILGFFTTLDSIAPGNWGLFDQVAAVEWVRNKIAAFGGNPRNITLFGHGAGGVSVGLHVLSPESTGFQAAIAMSGSAATPPEASAGGVARDERPSVEVIRRMAERFYCSPSTADVLTCMRNVHPVTVLIDEALKLTQFGLCYFPVVDGKYANSSHPPFLPDDPQTMLQEATPTSVPLLVGYTDNEDALLMRAEIADGLSASKYTELLQTSTTPDVRQPESENNETTCLISGEQLERAVTFYYSPIPPTDDHAVLRQKYMAFITEKRYGAPAYAQATASSKVAPTWLYRFDYRLKTQGVGETVPDWVNVPHQYDLPFVWGMPYWTSLPSQAVWNSQDKKIADIVMSLWTSFAKTRNPTQQIQGGAVKWEPFTEQNPSVMILDRNFSMTDSSNFDYKSFAFWNSYYPKVVESLTNCCNQTAGSTPLLAQARPPVYQCALAIAIALPWTCLHYNPSLHLP